MDTPRILLLGPISPTLLHGKGKKWRKARKKMCRQLGEQVLAWFEDADYLRVQQLKHEPWRYRDD